MALPESPLSVWGLDGRLHPLLEIQHQPRLAAAANWLALATVAARMTGKASGLLIDIGSTTTDLIPLAAGSVAARGRTDTERLQTGELVYAGVRRTPLCALTDRAAYRGRATRLAAEVFATTLDVFVTLGRIAENPEDCATADGRPATIDASRDRLARTLCDDRETFTADDAVRLAHTLEECLLARLLQDAGRVLVEAPKVVVIAGASSSRVGSPNVSSEREDD